MGKQTLHILLIAILLVSANPLSGQTIPRSTPELEGRLLAVIESDASYEEKAGAFRQLAVVGSAKAVPVLAKQLADEKTSHMARYALETIPGPVVNQTLREALGQLQGKSLVGVIGSIGVRRDTQAVNSLAVLLTHQEPAVSQAAMRALGSIGNEQAVALLKKALPRTPAQSQLFLCEGLLRCAERLAGQGDRQIALGIYAVLMEHNTPHQVQTAAIRGAIVVRGVNDLTLLRQSLASRDYIAFSAAVRATRELPERAVTQALVAGLEDRPTDYQVLIIGILGLRGDIVVLPELHDRARRGSQPARLAALKALSQLAQAATVPVLVTLSTDPDNEIAAAAATHLAHFPNRAADVAIREMLTSKSVEPRLIALELTGRRRMAHMLPLLLQAAADPDVGIRVQALKTLAELGGSEELVALLVLLPQMTQTKDLDAMRQALTDIVARTDDVDAVTAQLLGALSQVNAAQKVALLRVLSSVGGSQALAIVRNAVDDPDEEVRLGAIRALGTWKSADAAPELLALTKTADEARIRILCLRGYLTLAGRRDLSGDQRLDMCQQIASHLQQPAERKQWLGVLGRIDSPKALAQIYPYLDKSDTRDTACAVSLAMVERLAKKNRQIAKNPTVKKTLQKVRDVSANADYQSRAQKLLAGS